MIESVQISTNDGTCDAWLAAPAKSGRWPGVIFVPDAVGPRKNLKAMAERLALEGYIVLLPNIFYRNRPAPLFKGVRLPATPADMPKLLEQIMPLVMSFELDKALNDMASFIAYLEKRTVGKLGIFGYCMGGALAIRTAARYADKFAAVASFHAGGLVTDGGDSPHKLLWQIKASLYVGHADQDPHMTAEQIKVFDAEMATLKVPHRSEVYLGAKHHFTMPDLPDYNQKAAELHWERLVREFKAALGGKLK